MKLIKNICLYIIFSPLFSQDWTIKIEAEINLWGMGNIASDEENYIPISKIFLVEWQDPKTALILLTKSDIDSFHNDDQITVSIARPSNSEYIINSPIVDPFQ